MNKQRRKVIESIQNSLEELSEQIEVVQAEEQDYLDNMPENLQMSEKASRAEEVIDNLGNAFDLAYECIQELQGASE